MVAAGRRDVIDVCLEGIEAVEYLASRLPDENWDRPTPCPEWTASDLVGHVLCVAEDYNAFLDGLIEGRTEPLLLHPDLDAHNAARLAQLDPEPPLVRLAAFGLSARRFVHRAEQIWGEVIFVLDGRPWTVGHHVALCAIEWHVHAWDLAGSSDLKYRPARPDRLAAVWRLSTPYLTLRDGDEWTAVLLASGRAPAMANVGGF